jgi:hypothetical protein
MLLRARNKIILIQLQRGVLMSISPDKMGTLQE